MLGVGATGGATAADGASAWGMRSRMYCTICSRVTKVAISAASTSGSSGACSRMAERISTRLMESTPRSDSSSICRPSMSAG